MSGVYLAKKCRMLLLWHWMPINASSFDQMDDVKLDVKSNYLLEWFLRLTITMVLLLEAAISQVSFGLNEKWFAYLHIVSLFKPLVSEYTDGTPFATHARNYPLGDHTGLLNYPKNFSSFLLLPLYSESN